MKNQTNCIDCKTPTKPFESGNERLMCLECASKVWQCTQPTSEELYKKVNDDLDFELKMFRWKSEMYKTIRF